MERKDRALWRGRSEEAREPQFTSFGMHLSVIWTPLSGSLDGSGPPPASIPSPALEWNFEQPRAGEMVRLFLHEPLPWAFRSGLGSTAMPLNQGCTYRERVSRADDGATLLPYHARRYTHSTLEGWRATIEAGRVHLNGSVAGSEQVLRAGDRLEVHRPPWYEPEAPLWFEVAHEDEAVLAVLKPAGLQVLPAGPFHAFTLLALVRASAPERATSAPVHRLGRGTSGLILFGKSPAARASLSAQFRERRTQKTYLALVEGTLLPDSCQATHAIGKRPHGPMGLACAHPGGQPARTRVRVLRRDRAAWRSLVAAQPITGRPNQIRVHLAALGAPLVGDPLFGPGGLPKSEARPGEGGYFLHAAALACEHPSDGRWIRWRSRPAWLEPGGPVAPKPWTHLP